MTSDPRFDYTFRGRAFKMKSENQVPTESLTMETPSKGVKMSTYLEVVNQLSIFDSYLSSASDIIDQSVLLSLRSNGLGSLSVVSDLLTKLEQPLTKISFKWFSGAKSKFDWEETAYD